MASSEADPLLAAASGSMPSPSTALAATGATLSKSAAKRLAKQAHWASSKVARRQREKEKKASRKAAVREQIAAGDGELAASERERAERSRQKNALKQRFDWRVQPATGRKGPKDEAEWFQARCVVDLGFDELMMEKVRVPPSDLPGRLCPPPPSCALPT